MKKSWVLTALVVSVAIGGWPRTAGAQMISVRDLLSACRKSAELCGQVLSDNSITMAYMWGGNCIPKDLTMIQRDRAVLRWLAAHPDLSLEDAGDGVADAVDALWPCSGAQ